MRSLNGEWGCASHLVYKFDKQIARCNNSQIKILNLFECHTYWLARHQKRNCKWRISRTKRFSGIEGGDELSKLTNWTIVN